MDIGRLPTPVDRYWDVIVIGAGMGGGMAGRRLAEQGHSVLFVEKGPKGHRGEQQPLRDDVTDAEARLSRGYWPVPVKAVIDGKPRSFFAPIGAGVGGSSVFYAASLERPERHDFESTKNQPHPTGGWPVGYQDFAPYYSEAERLLSISGTPDPLSREPDGDLIPPLPLSDGETKMMDDFSDLGLHPYRLHSAIRNLPGCHLCVGRKCPKPCKMDGRSAGVEPALETGRAEVLDLCEVREIREKSGSVSEIFCERKGQSFALRARVYILAAGALGSPRLLLASAHRGQNQIANSSGWVGRGLMFHLNELFAVWPKKGNGFEGVSKSIAFRDLYTLDGQRLGMVQSLGVDASYGNIAAYLKQLYDRSRLPQVVKLRNALSVPAALVARFLGSAKIFVGLLEDFPYPDNRVIFDVEAPEALAFEYNYPKELHKRRDMFRSAIRRSLKGLRFFHLNQTPEINFGHPMGTLRFGNDPKTSVLDWSCRSHDLANLYVADASFMPTSTGVNPSLTIGANALRVADIVSTRLKEAEPQS